MDIAQKIAVIGTSRGGLEALKTVLPALKPGFPAAVLIVMHVGSRSSILPELLANHCQLPVEHAKDFDLITPSRVLIAPADWHMVVENKRIRLKKGAKENHSRPAIDPLFRSAAMHFGEHATGVLLTGDLDDGTIGIQAIKAYGGYAIVQDPQHAEAPSMPSSALRYADVDRCVQLTEIAQALDDAMIRPTSGLSAKSAWIEEWIDLEDQLSEKPGKDAIEILDKLGKRSALTCPECNGSLWELSDKPLRYRCHTGHAYTGQNLLQAQDTQTEDAIWAAIRALQEKEAMLIRFSKNALEQQRTDEASEYELHAQHISRQAELLKSIVGSGSGHS